MAENRFQTRENHFRSDRKPFSDPGKPFPTKSKAHPEIRLGVLKDRQGLSVGQVARHALGIGHSLVAQTVGIDDEIVDRADLAGDFPCPIKADDHKSGGIGVGGHAIIGHDCRAQDILTRRIAGQGIDRMRVFLAILDVEVPVIARGGDAALPIELYDLLDPVIPGDAGRIGIGLIDPDAPALPRGIDATERHLATDLYHIVPDPLALEQLGDHVAGIALSDRGAVELDPRITLLDPVADQPDLPVADKRTKAVDHGGCHAVHPAEAKPPKVDERSASDVVSAFRYGRDLHRPQENLAKPGINLHRLVSIDFRDNRIRIKWIKGEIEPRQLRENEAIFRLISLILDRITGMEDGADRLIITFLTRTGNQGKSPGNQQDTFNKKRSAHKQPTKD